MARVSATVRRGKTPRPSGTSAMPLRMMSWAARRVIFSPQKWTSPPTVSMARAIAFSVLVLPAPLAPISATVSPSLTWKVMLRTAWMPP